MNVNFYLNRIGFAFLVAMAAARAFAADPAPRKIKDIVIYRDDSFYAAFPSIVTRPDGELVCAFRRAPNRRVFGEDRVTHTDPNSYLVLVRSRDSGETWSAPELIFAHPFGGSQDPCMIQLADHSLLLTSYGWAQVTADALAKAPRTPRAGDFLFMGGYLLRSTDAGRTWSEPIVPPPVRDEKSLDAFGRPLPAYNRGAPTQGADGRVYWVVATAAEAASGHTENHLMISPDGGLNWEYACPVARDAKVAFNEASLIETPKGDLVAFMRTEGFNDHTAMARSTDHGKSFEPWNDAGFQGHPHYALRLADSRVLLVYGYRHAPFGVRARVLDAELREPPAASPEIILRDDGGDGDLGYPWATMLPDGRVLVVYYFNRAHGTRGIEGTILEMK